MKKSLTLLTFLFVITLKGFSQNADTSALAEVDTSWKSGGFIGLNFNQISLSQWAPGGENNLSFSSSLSLFANYSKGKNVWDNNLDLGYGLIQTASDPIRKSDDKIELNSKYGRRIGEGKWYYSALLNFKSQFAEGYKYPDDSNIVSKFMSPAYLTVALGITYKPVEYFEVFFSPVTSKFTFVTDQTLADSGAYGVEKATTENGVVVAGTGKTIRSEFGAYLNMKFKKDIMENITFATKLELFNNYTDSDKDNAKNIDVNWETSLNMKVNKFVTASIVVNVIYDANMIERTQYKHVIGVGFGYKF
ncbi:MAG: DUF3078 domain-containing protein [Bacteroidia bacterium]|nr:DUF3078 domain-containing protein [Bacteroidia bacterium]